jgi:hypothetical protein
MRAGSAFPTARDFCKLSNIAALATRQCEHRCPMSGPFGPGEIPHYRVPLSSPSDSSPLGSSSVDKTVISSSGAGCLDS